MSGLPDAYVTRFDQLLAVVAEATPPDTPLVPFWPLRGASYTGELLIIGRSVNGWVDDWTAGQLRDAGQRARAVASLRGDAEPPNGDRMAWVTDRWGATDGYNTRRSAFWRVLSQLVPGGPSLGWPGRLVWTNLYKISPAAGWNPGADLQRAQQAGAIDLLRLELDAFAPRRVLAMTGTWIDPFRAGLGLNLGDRAGLVEGVGDQDGMAWVVAKHPMGKPGGKFVDEVREAFANLGAALPG